MPKIGYPNMIVLHVDKVKKKANFQIFVFELNRIREKWVRIYQKLEKVYLQAIMQQWVNLRSKPLLNQILRKGSS